MLNRLRRFLSKIASQTPNARRLQRLDDKLDKLLRAQSVEQRRMASALAEIVKRQKISSQWQVLAKGKLDAILRQQYLSELVPNGHPFSLLARRFNLNSQNEEDGMTLALLEEIGAPTHSFVEIGSGTHGGNSGFLAEEFGWRGLMVDCHPERVLKCDMRFGDPGRVACVCATVTPQNINEILTSAGFTGDVDLFSLDIDSHDYWGLRGNDGVLAAHADPRIQQPLRA